MRVPWKSDGLLTTMLTLRLVEQTPRVGQPKEWDPKKYLSTVIGIVNFGLPKATPTNRTAFWNSLLRGQRHLRVPSLNCPRRTCRNTWTLRKALIHMGITDSAL